MCVYIRTQIKFVQSFSPKLPMQHRIGLQSKFM